MRAYTHHMPSPLSDWQLRLLGLAHQARGWGNILAGALLWDRHRRGLGNRQRLVGILQRSGRADRRVVQEFVNRWTDGNERACAARAATANAVTMREASVDGEFGRTGVHFW